MLGEGQGRGFEHVARRVFLWTAGSAGAAGALAAAGCAATWVSDDSVATGAGGGPDGGGAAA